MFAEWHLKRYPSYKRYFPESNGLSQVLNTIDPKLLREVESFIEDVVDFEASSMEARFIVKRGVDEEVHIELM